MIRPLAVPMGRYVVMPDRLSSPMKKWFTECVDVADSDTMFRVSPGAAHPAADLTSRPGRKAWASEVRGLPADGIGRDGQWQARGGTPF